MKRSKRVLSSCILACALVAGASAFTPTAFGCGSTSGPSGCRTVNEQSQSVVLSTVDAVAAWFRALIAG